MIAAAAAVPLLVLLYFLKLKRREQLITSTLLWKRAVQDLQVNAPFQRLRRNILLLLQLLAMLAVLLALAGPVSRWIAGGGRRYVLLIDRSGSMNAADGPGLTRLDRAKRKAKALIESLRSRTGLGMDDRSDQAMVIAFDDHAKVLCNFTSDKRQLSAAVEAVRATDGGSSLAEAVAVARAFATSPGEDANNRSATEAAELVLFSDGKIRDLDDVVAGPDELKFHRVGESSDNVAVVAMQARRSYEHPDQVAVFAGLANCGDSPVNCEVQLSVDGHVRSVRPVRLPAWQGGRDKLGRLGQASVSFSFSQPGSATVEVRLLADDPLPADNAAWAILPPPKKLSVLLVSAGNPALAAALESCSLAGLDEVTPEQFDKMDSSALALKERYDVIVLDGHAAAKAESLPRGQYLVFGPPPQGIGVQTRRVNAGRVIVDWQRRHPVLQHVDLGGLFVSAYQRMVLPRDGLALAEFADAPAVAILRRGGSVFLLAGFDVMETNWPFEPGLVMFCYNATRYLGMELVQTQQASLAAGSALAVRAPAGDVSEAQLTGPAGLDVKLTRDSSGTFRYPKAARAGIYTLAAGRADTPTITRRFAVNFLNPRESDIHPASGLVLSGREVQAETAPARSNRELWPVLVAVALALVCLEWLIYNSKVRI